MPVLQPQTITIEVRSFVDVGGVERKEVQAFVRDDCPGLAIHPATSTLADDDWAVTHLQSGKAILTAATKEAAERCMVGLATLADWRMTEAEWEAHQRRREIAQQIRRLRTLAEEEGV